ncbi:membrane protein implicated in regulation of membrane protease activity [Cryobacterium sp. MP_M5]|uniref:cytochrome c oxidase subunit 4 n=1 Tax=unclassified Cryobacterium TaxID=2649013 RepID=UPI0018CB07DF|nr:MULTISPECIES: cytochrome c oxidase subunit 4 [unclassified Cryobacterium]MBG6059285.1 membrane protein implicated in regulation of membrane protease activity [Cryobacterium sp. MP_M3]MEC5177867.1 membrane protein implicated in regulation of membrane protease activity [Cryobacterium sp. MP_M5]
MRANVNLLWILAGFFTVVTTAYVVWGLLDPKQHSVEWAGTFALGLCAVFVSFVAFYLNRVHGAQGGELPEDRLDSNIDDGDPEVGFFSPWSWWPILLAGSAALLFLGLAVGVWISIIALGLGVICLVGWVYEYYRGMFAR